jgi:hypothetical protein
MATEAQIKANRENSAKSTGPSSTEGLYTSCKNAVTTGLWTQTDYVQPGEEEIYHMFVINMHHSFEAVDILEEHLAAQITSAAWRLRRCDLADGELAATSIIDPLLDPALEKRIRSIERARAHSTSVFHRALNQMKKLQKERKIAEKPAPAVIPTQQQQEKAFLDNLGSQINNIMHCEEPDWDEIDRQIAENKAKAEAQQAKEAELASNCKTPGHAATTASPQSPVAPTPSRNRHCPCKSGKIYKHCCAKKVA